MTTTDPAALRHAVRTTLIELLVPGERSGTASTATLDAVAEARRDLAALHGPRNPTAHHAPDHDRHTALSAALGDIGKALLAHPHQHPEPWRLRTGLSVLAAITLAWLDTLPHPHDPGSNDSHESDDGLDAEPF